MISINAERLLADLSALARIGAEADGGVTRLAYTPAEQQARTWFIRRARQAGLTVSVDDAGNALALEPQAGGVPPILSGSHLDTVPRGGRFDGMLGVVAALEAVRAVREHDKMTQERRPLGVLALAAEESSRFGVACLGSQMLAGLLPEAALHTLQDAQGVTLLDAMKGAGLQPQPLHKIQRPRGWFHEFVELHIDQSDELAQADVALGLITGIAAPTRLRIELRGRASHSGSTPMEQRQDALVGAAEIILAVERAAMARRQQGVVGTVGILHVEPNAMNVVPGRAELGVDIRGIDEASIQETVQQIEQATTEIAQKRGLRATISVTSRSKPQRISQERVDALARVCQALGVAARPMVSRAGHDAMYLAALGPVSMLFVRNPAGVSHNPAEFARDEDIVAATTVLAAYLAQRAMA